MLISVASGKGGTGKTTLAVGLAFVAQGPVQFLDCDVEEPNGHLFLRPQLNGAVPVTMPVPEIDYDKCTLCGICAKTCLYNALAVMGERVLLFPELCHGCGACMHACPENAISEKPRQVGVVQSGKADSIDFVHGLLNIGEPMATTVIRAVKSHIKDDALNILDASPGTACPVVEAVKGSDFCILVTEPTPFGLSDLTLAAQVMQKLGIPSGVVINRSSKTDADTVEFCRQNNLPLIGRIPFERRFAESYASGVHPAAAFPEFRQHTQDILDKAIELGGGKTS